MSPRPYSTGRRRALTDATKHRVLTAGRDLLVTHGGKGFTVDAVAARAGVARMTVYYQFGSKKGLRDALFSDLAARGLVATLRESSAQSVPFDALAEFIGSLAGFWAADRPVIRRLRSLALLDPAAERTLRAADEHRLDAARHLVKRFAERHGRPSPAVAEDVALVLFSLTSFETFDALAGASRPPEDVATLLIRAAHAALELEG
ncbi:MAG: TetR/AcrR family transcriptional regulator [Acidobacteria bacterium]|nr:TetR/AcrR family transcriptional regulator [Acidobacteriota bacterium]